MGTNRLEGIGPFRYQRHVPQLPASVVNGRDRQRHRIVVVGGGPVGLAVALGLARHGVASIVLERDDSVCEGSRAAAISHRSLQIVERLGAVAQFLETGLPWTDGWCYWRDRQVLHFSTPVQEAQKLPAMINLQQYYIEQYLVNAVERINAVQPGMIALRWNTEVIALRKESDGIALSVHTPAGKYAMRADWLIACDGGQSFVRNALGLKLYGTAYEGRYVIIDILLPSQYPAGRRVWFDPSWHPGSTILMHRQPDNLWRIDYQLRADQSIAEALQPASVQCFVQRHLDAIGEGNLPWEVVWTSEYRAGAMTLEHYRHGRILFAGNAAHAMPIFGVRGLNSGFDDADNLAWKLALVVCRKASERLLQSYSDERIQAFHINATNAMRSTEFMSPPARGFALMREAVLSLAECHPLIARLINPRQSHVIRYIDSPLSTPDSDAFDHGPMPGEVFWDAPLMYGGSRRYLSDCTGLLFTLLHLGTAPGQALRQWAQHHGVTLLNLQELDPDGAVARRYGLQVGEAAMWLLRPDDHVAARFKHASLTALTQALQRAMGAQG